MSSLKKLNYKFYDASDCNNPEQAYACQKLEEKKYLLGLTVLYRHDFLRLLSDEDISPEIVHEMMLTDPRIGRIPQKWRYKFKAQPKPHPRALRLVCAVNLAAERNDIIEIVDVKNNTCELPDQSRSHTFENLNLEHASGCADKSWTNFLTDYDTWIKEKSKSNYIVINRATDFAARTTQAITKITQRGLASYLYAQNVDALFLHVNGKAEAHTPKRMLRSHESLCVSSSQQKVRDCINMGQLLSVLDGSQRPLYSADKMQAFSETMERVLNKSGTDYAPVAVPKVADNPKTSFGSILQSALAQGVKFS